MRKFILQQNQEKLNNYEFTKDEVIVLKAIRTISEYTQHFNIRSIGHAVSVSGNTFPDSPISDILTKFCDEEILLNKDGRYTILFLFSKVTQHLNMKTENN